MAFHAKPLGLPGVLLIQPDIHRDSRGSFVETYHESEFQRLGINHPFVQHNRSESSYRTLRGLHFQGRQPQAKLCSVIQGKVFDVILDIRLGSPTFGKHVCVTIAAETMEMIYIPEGCAHGFMALAESTIFSYKVSRFYSGHDDQFGVRWDDPSLNIPWPCREPLLSEKDAQLPSLKEVPWGILWQYFK